MVRCRAVQGDRGQGAHLYTVDCHNTASGTNRSEETGSAVGCLHASTHPSSYDPCWGRMGSCADLPLRPRLRHWMAWVWAPLSTISPVRGLWGSYSQSLNLLICTMGIIIKPTSQDRCESWPRWIWWAPSTQLSITKDLGTAGLVTAVCQALCHCLEVAGRLSSGNILDVIRYTGLVSKWDSGAHLFCSHSLVDLGPYCPFHAERKQSPKRFRTCFLQRTHNNKANYCQEMRPGV